MTTVLIADDHRLFTDLVGAYLVEHGLEVTGVATTEIDVLARAARTRPDVCLVDAAALATDSAVGLVTRLAQCVPDTRVVVLTATADDPGPDAAAAAGAAGHLLKSASGHDLVEAVTRAARGELAPLPAPRAAEQAAGGAPAASVPEGEAQERARLAGLRDRERECLELIAGGASTEEMAETMGVTVATVRSHVRAVLAALGVHSRLGAASFALRHGVVGAGRTPHDPPHRTG